MLQSVFFKIPKYFAFDEQEEHSWLYTNKVWGRIKGTYTTVTKCFVDCSVLKVCESDLIFSIGFFPLYYVELLEYFNKIKIVLYGWKCLENFGAEYADCWQ
jgi:hypothetical protein